MSDELSELRARILDLEKENEDLKHKNWVLWSRMYGILLLFGEIKDNISESMRTIQETEKEVEDLFKEIPSTIKN